MSKGKVVVAMSGGVDSSVAACLLHEQGYEVIGLFMRTGVTAPDPRHEAGDAACGTGAGPDRHRGCCSAVDADDARSVAGRLGIPFFSLNFSRQFDEIIDYFAAEYQRGRTPNPCVVCNDDLKFGRLANYGRATGADFVATGHYARVERLGGGYRLLRSADERKDQSYVLFGMDRALLPRVRFPIGGMVKDEVRDHARRFGLPVHDKPDSVDICFVPDRDYARVVRERRPEAFVEGPIVDIEGREVGRHDGTPNFTIGQRRGLGVAMGLPIYVTRIDPDSNTVTVGTAEALDAESLDASRVNWLIDPPAAPIRAEVKIRYQHRPAPATVAPRDDGRAVHVHFDHPQRAITPGQAVVFYDGDIVLGGGWID